MRASVNQTICESIGICVMECPEVFRFHPGNKKAYVMLDEIPTELQARCRKAAKSCPVGAISIEE